MKTYVCGFYSADNRVALMRKMKPEWQRGRLNGIGGKIEEGESPLAAMCREFREKTGFDTHYEEWTETVIMNGDDMSVYFFSMKGYLFKYCPEACDPTHLQSGEYMVWVDKDNLPQSVIPNLRWLIPLSFDNDLQFPIVIRDRSA